MAAMPSAHAVSRPHTHRPELLWRPCRRQAAFNLQRQRSQACRRAAGPAAWRGVAKTAAASAAAAGAAIERSAAAAVDPMQLPPLLEGVRVVLVAPKTPANIGAAVRLAENFEAHDLVIVAPRCDPFCSESVATSCQSPLLDHSVRVVPTLADALADCSSSVGFTRRSGAGRTVHASLAQLLARFPAAIPALEEGLPGQQQQAGEEPAAAADAAAAEAAGSAAGSAAEGEAGKRRAALVFGREESGLLEAELQLCAHACAIPTGRAQPSLNLSHAVAVVLSQLFDLKQQRLMLALGGPEAAEAAATAAAEGAAAAAGVRGSLFESDRAAWRRELALEAASQAELEALLSRAARLLESAGISAEESVDSSNHGRKRRLMGHARAMLLRSQAGVAEVRALHWLCREVERRQQQQQGDGGGGGGGGSAP